MTHVQLVVDGSAPGNGTAEAVPGGWAALLMAEGRERLIGGAIAETTNNRAELTAALEGLRALRRPCEVTVVTDSTYIYGSLAGGWKRRANHDILAEIDRLMAIHQVGVEIVRGHSGHLENERVDQEARRYAEVAKSAAVAEERVRAARSAASACPTAARAVARKAARIRSAADAARAAAACSH